VQVTREDVRLIGESLLARGVAAVSVRAAPRHPSGPLHPSLFGASAIDLLSNFPMEDALPGYSPPKRPPKRVRGLDRGRRSGTPSAPSRASRSSRCGGRCSDASCGGASTTRACMAAEWGSDTIMLQLVQYIACFHSSAAAAAALSSRLLAHAPIWNAPQESTII
jgi:hypothetical protein